MHEGHVPNYHLAHLTTKSVRSQPSNQVLKQLSFRKMNADKPDMFLQLTVNKQPIGIPVSADEFFVIKSLINVSMASSWAVLTPKLYQTDLYRLVCAQYVIPKLLGFDHAMDQSNPFMSGQDDFGSQPPPF